MEDHHERGNYSYFIKSICDRNSKARIQKIRRKEEKEQNKQTEMIICY